MMPSSTSTLGAAAERGDDDTAETEEGTVVEGELAVGAGAGAGDV